MSTAASGGTRRVYHHGRNTEELDYMNGVQEAWMSARYRRPDWVRRINLMGDAVGGRPGDLVALDADELLRAAQASTGLGDFGPGIWREAYEKLVAAIEAEAQLHTLGRLMTRAALLRSLRTRLLVTRILDEHPEILDEEVLAPIVISGPSRSGTTITFELLAQDPELRAPLAWEGLHPLPLPETPPGSIDPRPAIAESEQDFWEDTQPEFAAIHELRATLPVECITFMAADFHHAQWSTELDIPSFSQWAAMRDPTPHYEFHKRILQILQWQGPRKRWLLKSPGHLGSLPSFFAVYPDGCVVHTHRDPVKTIPSTVNTTVTSRWLRTDHVREAELCQGVAIGFQMMLAGVAEGRKSRALPADRFGDIHFQALMRDPIAAIGDGYAQLGMKISDEHAKRIVSYLEAKPRAKHGAHKYTPEEFGFTTAGLREQYLPYTDHYAVELEA